MPPDPANLIDTILTATPTSPDGEVITEWRFDRERSEQAGEPVDVPSWGDPRPVAARQAAAALRWAADFIRDDEYAALGEDRLRELADQLDTQAGG